MSAAVVVSCEHAGHGLPPEWAHLHPPDDPLLTSHRGWDPGAREVAEALAGTLDAPLHLHAVTRLLADTNRSPGHPRLFGPVSRRCGRAERERIVGCCYTPYRRRVEREIRRAVEDGKSVVHVSVHSFAPVLDGKRRSTGVGLLYDPARDGERHVVHRWQAFLREALPDLRVHRNRPYRGTSDGFTTHLRSVLPAGRYAGIEVEVRSDLVAHDRAAATELGETLAAGLAAAVG